MERYLVTGGGGFIGSHLVEALVAEGHFVRVVDNFDTGTRQNLKDIAREVEIIEASVQDPLAIQKAVEGIDFVLHQAARGSVPRSLSDPGGTHESNLTGTLQVLRAAHKAGVKRVVFASSSSVYGETPTLPKEESMFPSPLSPYAVTKLAAEYYCSVYARAFGLETVVLRYFNIYGPRQNPNLQYAAVIPLFIRQMLEKEPCTIFGDGEQTRDFTYVGDCVRANLLACKAPNAAGEVINIACGAQTSVNSLFELLAATTSCDRPPQYAPPRAGDVKHSYAAIAKAKTLLGYNPVMKLPAGLEKTVEWFQRNRHS
ncbi:MAG TPA: SDR family oxidoreductase [Acidobacteriota bacterium]|nr:SDR family oxidoreductase [Acidobacteriota bacterium]